MSDHAEGQEQRAGWSQTHRKSHPEACLGSLCRNSQAGDMSTEFNWSGLLVAQQRKKTAKRGPRNRRARERGKGEKKEILCNSLEIVVRKNKRAPCSLPLNPIFKAHSKLLLRSELQLGPLKT